MCVVARRVKGFDYVLATYGAGFLDAQVHDWLAPDFLLFRGRHKERINQLCRRRCMARSIDLLWYSVLFLFFLEHNRKTAVLLSKCQISGERTDKVSGEKQPERWVIERVRWCFLARMIISRERLAELWDDDPIGFSFLDLIEQCGDWELWSLAARLTWSTEQWKMKSEILKCVPCDLRYYINCWTGELDLLEQKHFLAGTQQFSPLSLADNVFFSW